MTVAERKAEKQVELIREHRMVKLPFTQAIKRVVANRDIPEIEVKAGEVFYLIAAGSYKGYFYICRFDATRSVYQCSCPAYGQCKHQKALQSQLVARYREEQAEEAASAIREAERVMQEQKVLSELCEGLEPEVADLLKEGFTEKTPTANVPRKENIVELKRESDSAMSGTCQDNVREDDQSVHQVPSEFP